MSTTYDLYAKHVKCCDCGKHSQYKPWDNPERKKRCAKCYGLFCEIKDNEELDPEWVELLTKDD